MIGEYAIKKLIDVAFDRIAGTLRKSETEIQTTVEDIEATLCHHLKEIRNWSSEISFADLRSAKHLENVFIPLDVFLHPRRLKISPSEDYETLPLEDLLSKSDMKHAVILGQPGAGKTTSMKHLCHRLIHDESFLSNELDIPLLIRLRDLNPRARAIDDSEKMGNDDLVLSALQRTIGLRIKYPFDLSGDEKRSDRRAIRDRILVEFIDSLKAMIILDGFDEIVAKTRREAVISQVRMLALQLEVSRILLTSRTGEFNYHIHIDNAAHYELKPLSEGQLTEFASNWLGADDGLRLQTQIEASPLPARRDSELSLVRSFPRMRLELNCCK